MTLARLIDAFSHWLDLVAGFVAGLFEHTRRAGTIRITEEEGGRFSLGPAAGGGASFALAGPQVPPHIAALLKGQAVELALDPSRFLVRPLDLPKGAADFLEGIVRSQIDRLTPWSSGAAVYGWTPPVEAADERIRLWVAAAPRERIAPCIDPLKAAGVRSITVVTRVGAAPGADPVRVLDDVSGEMGGTARIRSYLLAILGAAVVLATLALGMSALIGGGLDEARDELSQRIAVVRRAMVAGRDGQGADSPALRALERRKHEQPSTVLVLEALSQVLPDDTYVTELQVEGDKVQITGISRAAADLIRLMEQSQKFAQATFIAPTTPLTDARGERFQIEARITLPPEVRK